MQYMQ